MSLPSSSPAAANPDTAQGLPDFAVIGAAKSGSTSMYRLLEETRRQLTARFQAQQEARTDLTGLDFGSWWR